MSHHDARGSRRRFLARSVQIALGSAAAFATMGRLQMVQAATGGLGGDDDYRALVCVYLFGGNDSFNMVVPRTASAYSNYQAARPNLSIPQANLLPITPLSGAGGVEWGLHPAMPEMRSLFESGHAALLANVGPLAAPTSKLDYEARRVPLPPQLFSHVDQQAYSMSMGSETAARAGWGARIADRLAASGQYLGGALPTNISISGSNMWQAGAADGVYAMNSTGPIRINDTLRDSTWSRVVPRRDAFYKLLDAAKRESSIFTREHARISERAIAFSELAHTALSNTPPLTTPFPPAGENRLADSLLTVARTIAARRQLGQKRQVFFIGVGGWDMHDNMLSDHTELLGLISRSLALFHSATVELGVSQQVTTFTMTDFGRTLNNNGDGTDHGWGGHSWLIGGDVVGRKIYGQMPELRLGAALDVGRGRIIPTTSIDQLGSTLARWFGLRYGDAVDIFPNLRNFGSGADYLPMLASSNRLINEVDFERRTMR
ncbi:DUF1501 domain-containing protein [Arenimonas terrae]|uniref:DUF1501 domain-containing protein n=1 Tax=Arenimonas terrae TaxID=2546226 RepID=A0A5C4RW14_9GAMM|nr:DUF1501 domain-containing protein [Arenimonas terrae]TNJ35092.1 DUF1501 domain-containing protein [Arenimonas terrae]